MLLYPKVHLFFLYKSVVQRIDMFHFPGDKIVAAKQAA